MLSPSFFHIGIPALNNYFFCFSQEFNLGNILNLDIRQLVCQLSYQNDKVVDLLLNIKKREPAAFVCYDYLKNFAEQDYGNFNSLI